MPGDHRYDRHLGLFGEAGQRRIESTHVTIVGLGGLGSHVAQQTAFLGVQGYVLVDDDIVTPSSLNRLIGATVEDAATGRPKVEVAKRLITAIQPTARVQDIPHRLEVDASQAAIVEADLVFGCLDDDLARLRLTELCARFGRPYMDLATDCGEDRDRPWYGGRILFASGGTRCLSCMELLDQRALARAAMTPEQLAVDNTLYGIPRDALVNGGPSVVSLNGVVASLAVTEFMAWATGLREPWPYLRYRGDQGRVSICTDAPVPDCYYCKQLWRTDATRHSL